MISIRPENISNNIELLSIYYKSKEYETANIKFYKDIIEIIIELPTNNLTINKFKIFLNTLNLKCSSRIITIFKLLFPDSTRLTFAYDQFLKITKILKNVKLSSFKNPVTTKDRNDLNEIFKFIPKKSYFDYKLIRFSKLKNNEVECQFLLLYSTNRTLKISDNLILYLKSFTSLDNIINTSKLKALTHL